MVTAGFQLNINVNKPSRRDTILALERFNPIMWSLNAAKNVGSGIGSAIGGVAKSLVPYNVKKAANMMTGRYDLEKDGKNRTFNTGPQRKPGTPPERKERQTNKKIENQRKNINNHLLANGLKSTVLTDMPTLQPGKKSGRFGMVEDDGRLIVVFYPVTTSDSTETFDDDVGFVMYDTQDKTFTVKRGKLRDTNYVHQRGFVSLANSVSRIPHYIK